ncbi:MAG TPA: T9SS type A sorting domain-containing protein [Bacteroidota bacterium]|nr:T9SS type A sorting domain-containing protein [Bacteroidota bacterium]
MKTRSLCSLLFVIGFFVCSHGAFAQWNIIPDLRFTNIYCFLAVNDSTVLAGGDNMVLMRSTNGGTSWTNIMGNGISVDTVLSLGEGLGYIFAGTFGVESFYRSSDLGNTWSVVNAGLPSSAQLNAFTFVGGTLFAATEQGVYSSADSGKTWQSDTAGLALSQPGLDGWGMVGIAVAGGRLFTIKNFGGYVYSSQTDSIYWRPITPEYYNTGYAMAAADTTVMIATQQGMYVYGGDTTWLQRNNGLPINDTTQVMRCLLATSDSLVFASLTSSSTTTAVQGLYVTSDIGKTWLRVNDTAFSGASVTAMTANTKYLYAGTRMGGWRIPMADVITAVSSDRPQFPGKYVLYQNYPNPFNPTTVISYALPASASVSLRVYDLLGREVQVLVDERQGAGEHAVTFNAGACASGVYFYRLQAGAFTQTKKLMILK